MDLEKEDGTHKGYKWCVQRVKHIVINQTNSWDCDGVHSYACKSIHMVMYHAMRSKAKSTVVSSADPQYSIH